MEKGDRVIFRPDGQEGVIKEISEFRITPVEKNASAKRDPGSVLPRWKCHKEVEAAKILRVEAGYDVAHNKDAFALVLINPEMTSGKGWVARVSHDFIKKHNPQVGGYYVRYEDGYESYSPAEAFEKGYTRLSDPYMTIPHPDIPGGK
jgi:hypothetical protein